jgi:hypothetical protein
MMFRREGMDLLGGYASNGCSYIVPGFPFSCAAGLDR